MMQVLDKMKGGISFLCVLYFNLFLIDDAGAGEDDRGDVHRPAR